MSAIQKHEVTREEDTELSRSLVYLVSTRGGDNYWARVINACTKIYTPGEGTLSVQFTPKGHYILRCNTTLFDTWSAGMKKLALIHEAGHVALRHIERLVRVMSDVTDDVVKAAIIAVFNYAGDFVVNDAILRKEPEFAKCHIPRKEAELRARHGKTKGKGEWTFLLPEEYGFPAGLAMEEYLGLLLKNIEKFAKEVNKEWKRQAMEDLNGEPDPEKREQKKEEWEQKIGEKLPDPHAPDTTPEDGESQEGDGNPQPGPSDDGDGQDGQDGEGQEGGSGPPGGQGAGQGQGRPGQSGKGRGQKGQGQGEGERISGDGLADAIRGVARDDPGLFKRMLEAFHDLTARNHERWNEDAKGMYGEEGRSLADRLKRQAKGIVRRAHNETKRDRGTVPAWIEALVKQLLEDEETPWDLIFMDVVGSSISSKIIEEIAMPNPNLINEMWVEPWPGYSMDFAYNIIWLDDTSGSMGDNEYARGCARMNQLLEQNRQVKVWRVQGDAAIQKVHKEVSNIQPPTEEELAEFNIRHGRGGTSYRPFFKYVAGRDEPHDWIHPEVKPEDPLPKPDLIIVVTDGGVQIEGECFPEYRPSCPIVWLLMPGCVAPPGMNNTAPDKLIKMFHIKDED